MSYVKVKIGDIKVNRPFLYQNKGSLNLINTTTNSSATIRWDFTANFKINDFNDYLNYIYTDTEFSLDGEIALTKSLISEIDAVILSGTLPDYTEGDIILNSGTDAVPVYFINFQIRYFDLRTATPGVMIFDRVNNFKNYTKLIGGDYESNS